jgi:Type II CAAX prenyl endopeptidase Rce1-like
LKTFLGYVKQFVKEELDLRYLAFLTSFLTVGVWLWYRDDYFQIMRNDASGTYSSFLFYFVLFAIPYGTAFGGYMWFKKRWDLLKNPRFWLLSMLAVGIFSFRSGLSVLTHPLLEYVRDTHEHPLYWFRIYSDIARYLAIMLPVTIYWYFDRKSSPNPYGFTLKNFNLKPYFTVLLIMFPFVLGFAFTDHFGASYPRAGKWGLQYFDILKSSDQKYFLFYELIYGIDFVSIEYFFRGFLVIAFARYVGPGAILPMASFYVFIHFGKPYVETISSFFGGSLVGILSYYSRSIWGGVVVHVGIAWLMELGAFVGKLQK